jgi:hypothetical protein
MAEAHAASRGQDRQTVWNPACSVGTCALKPSRTATHRRGHSSMWATRSTHTRTTSSAAWSRVTMRCCQASSARDLSPQPLLYPSHRLENLN